MDIKKAKQQLELHEGYRAKVYLDSRGNRTVGIGFNLERQDAPIILKRIGADYNDVAVKKYPLTRSQVELLLEYTLKEAEDIARTQIKNYDELDEVRQRVVVDMAFNMGPRVLRQFVNTKRAIESGDFELASRRMLKSKWAKQVKGRAVELAKMMKTGEDTYELD